MRILITGGFGYIGGKLALHLSKFGHEIILGTRNPPSYASYLPKAEIVCMKWDSEKELELICKGVDLIIHSAGMNSSDCAKNPVAALEFNGLASARLVSAAFRSKVPKFIFLSTSHVYGSPLEGEITEECYPTNLHPYATSNLAGENALLSAANNYNIGIVIRLSNAFGAPANNNTSCWNLMVNELCKQVVEKRNIILKTNGLQQRDFIGLKKACQIIEFISINERNSSIYNLGSGLSFTILDMAKLIQKRSKLILGFDTNIIFEQNENDFQKELVNKYQYKSNKLNNLQIKCYKKDIISEIDELIKYCYDSKK